MSRGELAASLSAASFSMADEATPGPQPRSTTSHPSPMDPAGEKVFLSHSHSPVVIKDDNDVACLKKKFSFLKEFSDNFIKKHTSRCTVKNGNYSNKNQRVRT
jgi:hypothetical protein